MEYLNIEKRLDEIKEYVLFLQDSHAQALHQVEIWNKDAELLKLRLEHEAYLAVASHGFLPSLEQWVDIDRWEAQHNERNHTEESSTGALFSYRFIRTEGGALCTVVCEDCHKKAIFESGGDPEIYQKLAKEALLYIGEIPEVS